MSLSDYVTPPHDDAAEHAALGACLRDPVNAIDDARLIVRPDDFYHRRHQRLYEAILAQADQHAASSVDLTTISARLDALGWLDEVGGYVALTDIFTSTPTAANVTYYANIVKAKSQSRALAQAARKIEQEANNPSDPSALLDTCERMILAVRDQSSSGNARPLAEGLFAVADRLDEVADNQAVGLTTPWAQVNDLASLRPGDFIVAASRTSVGKSILGGQVAMHVADYGLPVFFVSLEMELIDIAARLISARGDVDATLTGGRRKGTDDEAQRVSDVISELAKMPIVVDDSPSQSVASIGAQARRMKRKQGLSLVVVDYLQLIEVDRQKGETRATELGEVSRGLKRLAKELQVPILALCQLNREAEKDPEPSLRHLRESGAIEQDADQVWLFWRGEAMGAPTIHLKVEKHRSGPTGRVTLRHRKEFMRFDNHV